MVEADPVNPYQSPVDHRDNVATGNPLLIPGICMLVLASLTLLLILLSIPGQMIQMQAVDTTSPVAQSDAAVSIVALLCWIAMTAAIIWGSIGMIRLHGYRAAWVAAVLAVIPVCSPCFLLGIPFGIWGLVILSRGEVRARFRDQIGEH